MFFELRDQKLAEYTKLQKHPRDEEESRHQATLEVFSNLIETDFFDVYETDEEGDTILMDIVWAGNLDYVKFLVESGLDVNKIASGYDFALLVAARQGWTEIFNYLSPLTLPEFREIAEEVLPEGIIYSQRKNNHAVELFVDDAFDGNIDALHHALSQGIKIDAISSNGEAALHKAIRNNQLLAVELLLKAGANPNLKVEEGWEYTPLMVSISLASIDYAIFQVLIEAGANLNGSSSRGESVLMLAVLTLNIDAVRRLLELGVDVNAKDIYGHTALYYAIACRQRDEIVVEEIIRLLKAARARKA
ncbi:ankyrin repeat domain-containing protein [Nostoc sp. FACHB-280]|uniref:ankyrin repeat domain-containing protein n=1 Tax=Nostoc sp. FACHB-280 TaxID=2692839 RepID=UPI00168A54D0|nr:ankyrin repeat domain-containing protein [Nostoc sp. FACHB-280]MBD2495525.1 ankyrin repeat domain-containing protein [Nostoc sp. FACHB-280]